MAPDPNAKRGAVIRAVVFDLDGTLIDSRLDIAAAANHMLRRQGRDTQSVEQICRHVGNGARYLVAHVVGLAEDDPAVEPWLRTFLDYYTAHATEHTVLMADTRRVLDELSALSLALCTNKPRATTDATLRGLALADCFQVVIAGDDLPTRKPDPGPLLHIAAALGIPAGEMVMVGDGPQDIQSGRAAGARTVGVEGGILPREQLVLAAPDALIPLGELPGLLERWRND